MARRSKEDAEHTRELILSSALKLFAEKGYEHTTFVDIANRLKMTKGAVYWHFPTKEDLLTALVQLSFDRFAEQIGRIMPQGELTFPLVAEMMIKNALIVVGDKRARSFYRLMKCQIKWTDNSMRAIHEKLFTDDRFGPKQAFRKAIINDIAAKRVRAGVNDAEVATVCIALWDGLVQSAIDGFLECDLATTIRNAYAAIWSDISKVQ